MFCMSSQVIGRSAGAVVLLVTVLVWVSDVAGLVVTVSCAVASETGVATVRRRARNRETELDIIGRLERGGRAPD
jgi:hypothetical protein